MATAKLSRLAAHVRRGKQSVASLPRKKVGPVSTLDMGDFKVLRGVPVEDRKTHLNLLEKVKSFDQLRLNPLLKANITANVLPSRSMPPTPVQKVALKALGRPRTPEFKSWMIAAETGSGKTLAYLGPLISRLLDDSTNNGGAASTSTTAATEAPTTKAPPGPAMRSLILVPTVELAEQVLGTVAKCTTGTSLRTAMFAGLQNSVGQLAKRVSKSGLDIVVGTPDKILNVAREHPVLMQRALETCATLVVDEADSLMNASFESSTSRVIKSCPELQDLVFVTATIPRSFDKLLRSRFPNTQFLVTPSIHRLPRHIDFRVVEVWHKPYNNKKLLALQQALYSIYHDRTEEGNVKRVVVFVNLKRDVEPLVDALNKSGYHATGLNADRSNLAEFLHSETMGTQETPRMKVLVATDLVARGVDFHRVRNIILYDMPHNAADLLHRAGRTGRLGTKGRVLLLVAKSESKGWIRGLETIVKKGMALA